MTAILLHFTVTNSSFVAINDFLHITITAVKGGGHIGYWKQSAFACQVAST